MIKQVQKLPQCLEPRESRRSFCLEEPWRNRLGGAGAGRAAWDAVVQQSSRQAVLPAHRPRFPGRQPSPRPPPPPQAVCVEGARGGGPGVLPARLASLPLPPRPRTRCCVAIFPGTGRHPGPFFPGVGALAASCDAFCKPENWHLGRRCQMPCQTWFCKVSADTA